MNMYTHIREAVENGEVLLEWHPQPGEEKPPVPLLKVTAKHLLWMVKLFKFNM